jgi:hypothetical protein
VSFPVQWVDTGRNSRTQRPYGCRCGDVRSDSSCQPKPTCRVRPAQRMHTQLVDLGVDAGVRTKFADDIPMDRSRIEVTGKLARYLVLWRGKLSRITGSTGNLKREPSTSSRCQATERYSSIIRCDPGLVEARRVARLSALSSCLSICVSATVIGSPVDGVKR